MPFRLPPLLILMGLGLLFFADLLIHPDQTLYSAHSDLLAEFLPVKYFLVQATRQDGEVPLWCPYSFGGYSFIGDILTGIYYPPDLPLYFLPAAWLGAALSWSVVAHILVAGAGMYWYARSQALEPAAALVAGAGYMFAGKTMLHVLAGGHYSALGLAWLPAVLLCQERAIRRHSLLAATGAGALFALIVLNAHPQWTLFAGVFVALASFGPALTEAGYLEGAGPRSRPRTQRALALWLGLGAWTALVGGALAAVQLLPALEASRYASRSLGVEATQVLGGGIRSLAFFLGPPLTDQPFHIMWEDRGGFTLLWVMAAIVAPLVSGPRIRFHAAIGLLLILFAFGGAVVVQWLPGFRLFRQPSRMLLVATFPVALLVGATVQGLCRQPRPAPDVLRACRRWLVRLAVAFLILAGGFAIRLTLEGKDLLLHVYWLTLPATVPAAFWLLGEGRNFSPRAARVAWTVLLLVDLWALAWPLVAVRRQADLFAPSASVRFLADQDDERGRVLGRSTDGDLLCSPLGAGDTLAMMMRIETLRGVNPLDVVRYRQYLKYITNQGDPVEPLGPFTLPIVGNFPIRNRPLLDLLGTRYLLQPSDMPLGSTRPLGDAPAAYDSPELSNWRRVFDDPDPAAYDFLAGGFQQLPPYTLYENPDAFPRAFFVSQAKRLRDPANALPELRAVDFHQVVLLEDGDESDLPPSGTGTFLPADILEYRPNRVVVEVWADKPGYLVVTDVWFPGWAAAVDDQPARVRRANYLFRAVAVPAGMHRVVFTYEPSSYSRGKAISLVALTLVSLIGLIALGSWTWTAVSGTRRAAVETADGQAAPG